MGQGEGEPGDPLDGEAGHWSRASTSSRSRSASTSWPRSWARSWSCRASSRAGRRTVPVEKVKYSNIRRVGPESLRHFKRTFREALKRADRARASTTPTNPVIVPIREDRRYRSWHVREVPGVERGHHLLHGRLAAAWATSRRRSCASPSFWIDTWLRSQYKSLDNVYVVHEAFAKEVDQHTFYHLRESGGTRISTAYELINQIIDTRFPADAWNVYLFHFSDGENGDSRDTDACMEMLRERPPAQAQPVLLRPGPLVLRRRAASRPTSRRPSPGEDRIVTSEIRDKDEIYDAIKRFLGQGPVRPPPGPRALARGARSRRYAREYGLDFYDVVFEMLDYDQLNEVAAYGGFPTRYPHWRFGMEYEELAKSYSYGLSKIYELVINNNPVYAYLMKANAPVEQKLVMAHVFGHADFFKNNLWFSKTNRRMIDEMANHATRVRHHIDRHGVEAVEDFIDACLSLENLIDSHARLHRAAGAAATGAAGRADAEEEPPRGAAPAAARATWSRTSTRPAFLEEQKARQARAGQAQAQGPRGAAARRAAVPARARAARELGARRARDRARGGLLLRAAGDDEDAERGLGLATGTARS